MTMNLRPLRPLLLLGLSLRAAPPAPLLPAPEGEGYALAWADEFDGGALDASRWNTRAGVRFASRNLPGNVSVSNGWLRLALRKESVEGAEYTSGGVISKREFKYGYYEARLRSPAGAGWHTSFWMLKNSGGQTGNRQEIDVVEHDSKDPRHYGSNLHVHHPTRQGLAGRRTDTPDLGADFHVFGCEFSSREIRLYFDGALTGVFQASGFAHDPMSIWLTTVGWANLPWAPQLRIDDAALPAFADFDYVRFYEKPGLEAEPPPRPRTVVVFGDSLTEGGALPKEQRDQSWIRIVERESAGRLRMVNEGKGGRPAVSKHEFEAVLKRQPRADQVVIALGTNDSRDLSAGAVTNAFAHLHHMIDRARQAYGPTLPVLLVGPPNINKDALVATKPIGREREARLKELGEMMEGLARRKNCAFVSLFGVVPEASMRKDGVHPDAEGNAAMARVLAKALEPTP